VTQARSRPAAIVTGADSGIGRATAIALAHAGLDIGVTWCTDRTGAELTAQRVHALGVRGEVCHLDLARPVTAMESISVLADRLGGLFVLVNNGAINHRAPALEESLDDWQQVLQVNLTGAFACSQRAARLMIRSGHGGRIVNVTSIHEHVPLLNGAAYCAAKAGLGSLTKVMALELAPHGITVNSVAPGHIATPMTGHHDDGEGSHRPEVPVGRIGSPAEVAAAVVHLASARGAYTTGSSLVIDGGLSLTAVLPLQAAVETTAP
jgi:NAD(P)-dependent dehydrogenase (short-subunit alcohol dehydrogenase family)